MVTVNCCQPVPKEPASESVLQMIAKRYNITEREDIAELRLFVEFYSNVKVMENVTKVYKAECGTNPN